MLEQRDDTFKKLIQELTNRLLDEKSYNHVLSSMCTPPSELSRDIASLFAEINLGDPGLFPETVKMEYEVLSELALLLDAPKEWHGSITSGGSESNLIGCWAARNWVRKIKNIKTGTILIPESIHVSFEKAADILGLKQKWIPLDDTYRIDIEAVNKAITKNTVGIIGIAGTTGIGVCDNIEALSELAIDNNIYLHVDAAHGGTIYPYFNDLNLKPPKFAFENEGVKSITIDTHKLIGSLIPGGAIIFRSKEIVDTIAKSISYLSDSSTKQFTITGTRPGSTVIASWVLLKKLGRSYQVERVKSCLDKTKYFIEKLKQIKEIDLVLEPIINIIGFTSTRFASEELADKLREKGWQLSIYSNWIRIVVMPHVNIETLDKFVNDLINAHN